MKNKHRTIWYAICIAIGIILSVVPTQGEPLILIDLNDRWTYEVTLPSGELSLNQIVTEVNFTVEAVDYIGEGETQVRVNEINSTTVVDPILAMALEEGPFLIVEDMLSDSNATISIDIKTIIADSIFKTARGNLPFKRVTTVIADINITNIKYGSNYLPYYNVTKGLTFTQLSSNPTTIETFSTGTVKLNTINVKTQTFLTDFMNETARLDINLQFDERFEASDNFIYNDTTCRNITVTALQARIQDLVIVSQNASNYFAWQSHTVILDNRGDEEWVYAYDAGLPLIVEKEIVKEPIQLGMKLATTIEIEEMTMVLTDLDLINSDFEFEGTTSSVSSLNIIVILSVSIIISTIILIVLIWERKDWKKN